jgi:hypothetical protein
LFDLQLNSTLFAADVCAGIIALAYRALVWPDGPA